VQRSAVQYAHGARWAHSRTHTVRSCLPPAGAVRARGLHCPSGRPSRKCAWARRRHKLFVLSLARARVQGIGPDDAAITTLVLYLADEQVNPSTGVQVGYILVDSLIAEEDFRCRCRRCVPRTLLCSPRACLYTRAVCSDALVHVERAEFDRASAARLLIQRIRQNVGMVRAVVRCASAAHPRRMAGHRSRTGRSAFSGQGEWDSGSIAIANGTHSFTARRSSSPRATLSWRAACTTGQVAA
jgi:hypothetical protein